MRSVVGLVQDGLRRVGLDVRRVRREGAEYADVAPVATYSPWNTDRTFRDLYERIRGHTLVDVYRCYELWTLTRDLVAVPGAILEVGVWRGGTGAILAKAAESVGIEDPVYLCDTFRGVPKAGPRDPVYRGGEHADTSRGVVERLVAGLSLGRVEIVEGIFPDESAGRITAKHFRLVHVDVDVYQSAKDCVEHVWPRTSTGGVVVFDDYGFDGLGGIRQYVDELRGRRGSLVVHNLNGHALVVKVGP